MWPSIENMEDRLKIWFDFARWTSSHEMSLCWEFDSNLWKIFRKPGTDFAEGKREKVENKERLNYLKYPYRTSTKRINSKFAKEIMLMKRWQTIYNGFNYK